MRNTPAHYDVAGSPDGCGGVDDPPRLRTLRRCGAARPFTRVRDRAAPARIVERLDRWSTRGIAIDLPAHGESDGVPAPFHELAARLHDRLGSLAVDRPIMVGHSMSGGLASFYASTYPTRGPS